MFVLGIESTAHTFGVAILHDKKILANIRNAYTTEHGGMIPAKVAEHHQEVYRETLDVALRVANIPLTKIQLIAYSNAPGLGHTLRIGAAAAKSLALKLNVPLVPVNHAIAHLEVTRLVTKAKDPVLLYCSGANTQVIAYDAHKFRILGETLDIGVGNFLDTLARNMGLGFPGGPKIEQLAKAYEGEDLLELPYTVKGMDFSLAGLETHCKNLIATTDHALLAYSVQEHVFAMVVETAERAMAHLGKSELALGGGVACNARLQEMCMRMCEERGAKCFIPARDFLVDNAAMIAWTGLCMHTKGKIVVDVENATINPYERADEVRVLWR